MQNIAKVIKDQTDSILRRRQATPGANISIRGSTTQPGTGPGTPPEMTEPNRELDRHKVSGDHDGRYYTEAEIDALIAALTFADVVRQAFDNTDYIAVEHNLGRRPMVQVQGSAVSAYGEGLYGAGNYGGISPYTVLSPTGIEHSLDSNTVTITLASEYTGEVICVG